MQPQTISQNCIFWPALKKPVSGDSTESLRVTYCFDVLHPAGVVGSPGHHLPPIQRLQREEEDESQAEPRMQEAGGGSAPEQWRKEAENPRQIDPEARQQGQEEEDPDHPVEKRVY